MDNIFIGGMNVEVSYHHHHHQLFNIIDTVGQIVGIEPVLLYKKEDLELVKYVQK